MYSIEKAVPADAARLAFNMRACDRDEVWASHMRTPVEAVTMGIFFSLETRVAKYKGEPFLIFGVTPATSLSDRGIIWMLGTTLLADHRTWFLRESRREVSRISRGFRTVENWVDARSRANIRWLRWVGFQIGEAKPYGVFGMPFHHFEMEVS